MTSLKPVRDLELRPIEAPSTATPHAKVYVLLPHLDVLLGAPGFGRRDVICLTGSPRPFSPSSFFSAFRRRVDLH